MYALRSGGREGVEGAARSIRRSGIGPGNATATSWTISDLSAPACRALLGVRRFGGAARLSLRFLDLPEHAFLDSSSRHRHTVSSKCSPSTMENAIMGSKLVVPRSSPRLQRLPVTQARAKLGGLVSRVRRNKEYLILEQNGVPVAGVMDIDEFEDYLELRDPRVRTHIRQSSAEYLAGKSRPAEEFVAELRGQPRQKVRQRSKA